MLNIFKSSKQKASCTINGVTYKGSNIRISDNKIFIDGREVKDESVSKTININITGNVESLNIDHANNIEINGDVKGNLETTNGNITIAGQFIGDVETTNGDVTCGKVTGNVSSLNGDINHER